MNTKKAYELIQNILSGLPEKSKQSVLNKLFSNEKSNADSSAEKQEQLLKKCRQSKMVAGKMACPDCGSLNTIKNGFRSGRQRYLGMQIFTSIYSLFVLIPRISIEFRRLHDIDKSAWWLFISLVPIVGAIVLFVFTVTSGTIGANRYGADPKNTTTDNQ